MTDLVVTYRRIADLAPGPNARTHSATHVAEVAASICAYGWTNPVLIDEADVILAGYARIRAALMLGMEHVPTICIEGLNESQRRSLGWTDNRLSTVPVD